MSNSETSFEELLARTQELIAEGNDHSKAHNTAWLEHRIKVWKEKWGSHFWVLIYGDFKPPTEDYRIDELGITIHHETIENSVVDNSATCVLKATIDIKDLSVPSILDAINRINLLLGSWVLVTWGNAPCRWWSWLTHDSGGSVAEPIAHKDLTKAISSIVSLPENIRGKIDAALYWVREPKNLIKESARSDLLRIYVSYWNAFECLVEAVDILKPQKKLSKLEKQEKLDEYLNKLEGSPKPSDIIECYKIINPGFKAKAINVLNVCFGEDSQAKIDECFNQDDKTDCLYQIRNSINHGDIDAENLEELIRIQSRLTKLWEIVWGMFGRLVSFPTPVV